MHTIRARLTAGLLNKAARGELALILPVGLVRETGGVVVKNPDREVQARLDLIFTTFLRLRSASKVLHAFNERGLSIPRRGRFGDTVWRPPTVAAILQGRRTPLTPALLFTGAPARSAQRPQAKARKRGSRASSGGSS